MPEFQMIKLHILNYFIVNIIYNYVERGRVGVGRGSCGKGMG